MEFRKKTFWIVAVVILVFEIDQLSSISIEGQLTLIKNDCYERIAIGQKLDPKKVYKKFDYNTVTLCESECTKEKETCKAYSVGIGVKGNGTCELSKEAVKETIDLKPIGTIADSDFDLYIKKLDCQVVIEKPVSHGSHKPYSHHDHEKPTEPYLTYAQQHQQPQNSHVLDSSYAGLNSGGDTNHDTTLYNHPSLSDATGYHYDVSNGKPQTYEDQKGDVHHVQTLVSIASGPNSQLHPVHDILVAGSSYYGYGGSESYSGQNYGQSGNSGNEMTDYADQSVLHNRPYKRPLTQTIAYDRPDPAYQIRPTYFTQDSGYQQDHHYQHSQYFEIDRRKYESFKQHHQINEEESDRFEAYPPPRYRPEVNYNQYDDKPFMQPPTRYGSVIPHPNEYEYLFGYNSERPSKLRRRPGGGKPDTPSYDGNSGKKPDSSEKPNPNEDSPKNDLTNQKPNDHRGPDNENYKPIVSHRVTNGGQHITSIITELKDNTCFRRTLAGKRIVRGLVRRYLTCETAEQCQHECADEKRFTCEGFNYRLDPTGRGKGDCELLDLPLSRIDVIHEVVADPDYDYYARDRNAAITNCKQIPSRNNYIPYGSYGGRWNYRGSQDHRQTYGYEDYRRGDSLRPFAPPPRRPYDGPPEGPSDRWRDSPYGIHNTRPEVDRRHDYRRPDNNRRGDYSYHHSHESHRDYASSHSYHYNYHNSDRHDYHENNRYSGIHYLPASYQDLPPRVYDPYVPPKRYPSNKFHSDRDKDHLGPERPPWGSYLGSYGNFGYSDANYGYKHQYGSENRRNHYLPTKPEIPTDWGLYGGTYGNGGILEYKGYTDKESYNYWGFDKHHNSKHQGYLVTKGKQPSYLPEKRPTQVLPGPVQQYLPGKPVVYELDNFILPAHPRRPPGYDFLRDECSLRTATGFRLHKRIVKKFFVVPNIYECELLCFKEKQFVCSSYAYRYTVSLTTPTDNCFLSDRNHKELDFYIDLEPDRDFDIYTMNNRDRCQESLLLSQQESDCFWRVRSGQRLDHSVVRDSLTAKSVVDCQVECLKSKRFTCRSYSYRYTSPIIGGIIDNCQLTDWPFYELDPRLHFVPEPGFEIYERGSFGHGCEPDHFGIRGQHRKEVVKINQLCYVGFGSAARLLPQATRKSIYVVTELDCKQECSKARDGTLFRCMTFSYRTGGPPLAPNCYLSDIMQRDLLPNVDYVGDKDSWLFTWDNYNPECVNVINKVYYDGFAGNHRKIDETYGLDFFNALDTWRVYSVSGWPCRRGTLCKENLEAGFWFCELESDDKTAWDYCCRPDHQCGVSNGYPYEWCYVGPARSQWRKCSDRYYPYLHNTVDRNYLPKPFNLGPPAFRPDRPPANSAPPPLQPSLDEYEEQFDDQFLSPPKPGGFGLPRRWPVSYLHKEMPPNNTESDIRTSRKDKTEKSSKIKAIKSLIDVIKTNDFSNVQYHIANNSDKPDDILYVKIPLPAISTDKLQNKTNDKLQNNAFSSNTKTSFISAHDDSFKTIRTQKSLPAKSWRNTNSNSSSIRRGYVTRTNATQARKFNLQPY